MVTLILAFIFLTPHFWNYGDRPKPYWPANVVRAEVQPDGETVYEVPASMVRRSQTPTNKILRDAIAPVSGQVTVDRWEAVRETGGRIVGWRVWGHRGGQESMLVR
jgi:hypothetical protein